MKNLPLFTKKHPLTDILKNPLTDSLTSIYGTILPFMGSIYHSTAEIRKINSIKVIKPVVMGNLTPKVQAYLRNPFSAREKKGEEKTEVIGRSGRSQRNRFVFGGVLQVSALLKNAVVFI